jgi:GMP synthase-like glutamine amidotransferase
VFLTFSLVRANLDDLMSPVVACLHHLEGESTGHAGAVLAEAGITLDSRRLAVGDPLPELGEIDGVLAYGGYESVRDIAGDPVLAAQGEFLLACVEREMPVFGICLGGQLLAHVLGGRVERLPRRMLEWAPIEALPAADGDPVFGALPAGAMALHWNEDGFSLPPGAVPLARPVSAGAEAFRYGTAWGIQFHPEVGAAGLERWYARGAADLAEAGVREEAARAADARYLPGQRALAAALFGGFARVVAARTVAA